MNYGYNNNPYQQPYRPYGQPAWQQPAQPMPQMQPPVWQPPAAEPMPTEQLPQETREDPVAAAIRELTAEVAALRKLVAAKKKKETDDE